MKLTFEETMTGLDAIISQLDQELQNKDPQLKRPRLDDHQGLVNGKNDAEKYQALLELKDILDQQFKEFSIKANDETIGDYVNPHQDDALNEGDFYVENTSTISLKDTSNALTDEERLKIPLVGIPNADLSQMSLNEDTLNLLVKQDSNNPGVAIFPMSEQDKVKEDLTSLTGIDLDDLIKDVSESVGQVSMPVKVEESFVTVTMSNDQNENTNQTTTDNMVGKRPYYKYTETIADVTPNHNNPRDPQVNILSKRFEEGDLLSTDPKQNYRWQQQGPNPGITKDGHQMITPISKFGPNLEEIAQSVSDGYEDNVKVNVTTKTNIVNVFTFNIFVNNGTKDKDGYQLVKEAPFKSSIETTADVNTMNPEGLPTNSFSLYQYDANTNTDADAINTNSDNKKQEGAELEKWLKILLNHQAYGDGSNIVAEAVLKDTSLQQIPEPRTGSLYRRIEDETSTAIPSIGLLGYKTDFNGDIIKEGATKTESKQQKTLMESLAGSPIPTILAGLAAISPFFLAGGKKRRKKRGGGDNVEIPDQWLSYLLGTRYDSSNPTTIGYNYDVTTPKPPSDTILGRFEPLISNEIPATTLLKTADASSETTTTSTTIDDTTTPTKAEPEPTSRTLFVPLYTSDPPSVTTTLTKTFVRQSEERPSVHISKVVRNEPDTNAYDHSPGDDSGAPDVSSLLKHWASLYNSVKSNVTSYKPFQYQPYHRFTTTPSTITTPSRTTTSTTTTTSSSTTMTTSSTTTLMSKPFGSSTQSYANELKDKWSLLTSANTKLDGLSKYKKKAGYFANGNPIRIIDEAVSVSTSTSTEVNIVPVDDDHSDDFKFVPYPYTKSNNKGPPKTTDGRIKSTDVPPSLWLTAKDILSNLGSKLFVGDASKDDSHNTDMTNSPIVIIPVEDEFNRPPVNVQALKPIVSKNPITFINMNSIKPPRTSNAIIEKLSEPPSKQYVESIWSRYNKTNHNDGHVTNVKPIGIKTHHRPNIVKISQFPIETTTLGIRRPPWSNNDPNMGIGTVEELQVPSPVNIQSSVIKTDLTPEVMDKIRTNLKLSNSIDDITDKDDDEYVPLYIQSSVVNTDLMNQLSYDLETTPEAESDEKVDDFDYAPLSIHHTDDDNDDFYKLMSSAHDVMNQLKSNLDLSSTPTTNENLYAEEDVDYAPLSSQDNSDNYYALLSSTEKIDFDDFQAPLSSEDYAPLSLSAVKNKYDIPASYELFDPENELIESLKIQLQNSPLTHALHKGQWIYESQHYTQEEPTQIISQPVSHQIKKPTPILGTKNAFHNGQLLEWIKNLEKDIEPTRSNPSNIETTTSGTADITTSEPLSTSEEVPIIATATSSNITKTSNKTIDNRIALALVAANSATSSSVISDESTTTNDTTDDNNSPKTLGELVASALAQSAAPLAGLSAATLAYGAAAMLPVWLPLALGKRKRKRKKRSHTFIDETHHILSKMSSLEN